MDCARRAEEVGGFRVSGLHDPRAHGHGGIYARGGARGGGGWPEEEESVLNIALKKRRLLGKL